MSSIDDLEAFLDDPSGVKAADEKRKKELANRPPAEPDDEYAELCAHPHTYIRRKIRKQVEDVEWLNNINSLTSYLHERELHRGNTGNRCVVCTLPLGTCEHTPQWGTSPVTMQDDTGLRKVMQDEDTRDATTRELDEVLGMIKDDIGLETEQQMDDIDIKSLRWTFMQPRLSDKIGDEYIALSTPSARGWHATVKVGKFMLVHGGLRYKGNEIPQPFSGAARYEDIEYLSDIYVYDIANQSWHSPEPDPCPAGRYGHVMAALDERRVLMFGGRGARGRFLNDTWVYDIFTRGWTPVFNDQSCPPPSPRVFTSAAAVDGAATVHVNLDGEVYNDVFLFGGTDGTDNFGDLWVFRGHPLDMRWERTVGVGLPPSPRYGHRVVAVSARSVVIIGGCCVTPESELGAIMSQTHQENKDILEKCDHLQQCYLSEGAAIGVGSRALKIALDNSSSTLKLGAGPMGEELKLLLRQAGGLAGTVARLEEGTREAENDLVNAYYKMNSMKQMRSMRAKHPNPRLDITFLDHRDMTWKEQIYPPIKGSIPASRMHFGAAAIGPYLLIAGGTPPTSIAHVPQDHPSTRVSSLDMNTMLWTQPAPLDSTEYLEGPLRAAEQDITRAIQSADEAKMRGLSLGAKKGITVQYIEAEKVLEVCRWRKRMLLRERAEFRNPPSSRWGCSLTQIDQRAIFLAGWSADSVVVKGDIYTLDLEDELERRRRIESEFRAKLERQQGIEERHALQLEIQSAYELRAMIAGQRAQEARERELMAVEEVRSALPPLSRPNKVLLTKANDRSMWVEWERVLKDADNYYLKDPHSIVYILYARGGFAHIHEGDRVIIQCYVYAKPSEDEEEGGGSHNGSPLANPLAVRLKVEKGSDSSSDSDSDSSTRSSLTGKGSTITGSSMPGSLLANFQAGPIEEEVEQPKKIEKIIDTWGEVVKAYMNGTFDIAFDDGSMENRVDRSRIRPETPLEPPPCPPLPSVIKKSELRKKMRDRGKFKRIPEEEDEETRKAREKREKQEQKEAEKKQAAEYAALQKALGDVDETMRKIKEAAKRRAERDAKHIEELEQAKIKPTVKAGPEWRLLYIGKDTHYACTGIVPDDILMREPSRTVSVEFCVQTEGVDFPAGERSQLSNPATFSTLLSKVVTGDGEGGAAHKISKAKKEVVTAVVAGRHMELSRMHNAVFTEGGAAHYV